MLVQKIPCPAPYAFYVDRVRNAIPSYVRASVFRDGGNLIIFYERDFDAEALEEVLNDIFARYFYAVPEPTPFSL